MRIRHWSLFLAVAAVAASLDLWTKHLAFANIRRWEEVPVVPGFLSYVRTTNPGIVWGMGQGAKWAWLAISVAAVPAIAALFWSVKKPRWILTASLGMILGGTLGNMVDRAFTELHEVRDFIKFFYVGADGVQHYWPIFNLADSFICVGVFLLTFEMMFFDEKKPGPRAPEAAPAPPAAPVP
jgi:signal peptidase II